MQPATERFSCMARKTLLPGIVWLTAFAGVFALSSHAQIIGKVDPTASPKNHAIVTGAHIHTFGVGLDFQYRRKVREEIDFLLSVNLASYKDPAEARVQSLNADLGGTDYIYDKANHAYFLGATLGGQYVIVPRTEFSRVQVSAGLGAGPVLIIRKPYLLEVIRDIGGGFAELVVEPYQGPDEHPQTFIFGQAQYLQKLNLISTQWGFRIRGDLTVDFSGSSYFVRALHLGFQGDFTGSPVPILYLGQNRSVFWGVFAGFVIGNAWE